MWRRSGLGLLSVLPFVQLAAAAAPPASAKLPKSARLFVLMHRPGLHWDHTKLFNEQAGIADHVAYMQSFFVQGKLVAGGPFLDNSGGMMLFNVRSETIAGEIAANDPAVKRGLLQVAVRPWLDVFVR